MKSLYKCFYNITAWLPNSTYLLLTFFLFLWMFWLWSVIFLYVLHIKWENYWDKSKIPNFSNNEEYIKKVFYIYKSIKVLLSEKLSKKIQFWLILSTSTLWYLKPQHFCLIFRREMHLWISAKVIEIPRPVIF